MPTGSPPGSRAPTGVVFLDKARGISSFAALGAVKRAVGTKKVGHTGTLDPFATGLLVALVGRATRCARYFNGLSKEYVTVVRFGTETDSDDATGTVVRRGELPREHLLATAIEAFQGSIEQLPPAYSAVHVDGRRAHQIARAGETPAVQPRTVRVDSLEVQDLVQSGGRVESVSLAISCSAGTYIRSIARDLGRRMGSAAHAESLRRTAIGPFPVDLAVSGATIDPSQDLRGLAPVLGRLPGFAVARVSAARARDVTHGRPISADDLDFDGDHDREAPHRVALVRDEEILAVARIVEARVRYEAVLVAGDAHG